MSSKAFMAGWLVAAGVLSSWAVSAASDEAPRPAVYEEPARVQALPDVSLDLEAEIRRLRARTPTHVSPTVGARDPFAFGRRRVVTRARSVTRVTAVTAASASVVSAVSTASVTPEPAAPSLSGIAEITPGMFTAVVSFAGELHYVRAGEVIGGRYRIDSVALEGADVFDLLLGIISRLKLQSAVYNSH